VTYSIVARDADTGQLGVAAQSCYFALGAVLPWARAGVGTVATQSMVDPGYGPRCLDLLAGGVGAAVALAQVRAADEGREVRQVGVVDASGAVSSFTGSSCIDHVGHTEGDGFSAQANMMAGPGVCEAMGHAFTSTSGSLATRLVAALVAAEGMGGDARGQMSAALIVVEGERPEHPWQGVLTDVRVDHHPDPLGELARLAKVAEAYHLCDVAEEALVAGDAAAARRDQRRVWRSSRARATSSSAISVPSSAWAGLTRRRSGRKSSWRPGPPGRVFCGPSPSAVWSRCPRVSRSTGSSPERTDERRHMSAVT
jgi:uncharacterized Ntn-hydrolase superfamily protein